MSNVCNDDCSDCQIDCEDRQPTDFMEQPHEMSSINNVIGVVSGKGGVGKSLLTSLLAAQMNQQGFRTAVLDADVTGPSIPRAFGIKDHAMGSELGVLPVESKNGVQIMSINLMLENETDPVVWRGPILAETVKQFWTDVIWKDIDYMFVDLPPGTGDIPLTVFQSIPLDGIIIVTSPQDLVGMIVEKAVNMASMMNIPVLAIVENMSGFVCDTCGSQHSIFGESHIEDIANKLGIDLVCKLPINPKFATFVDAGEVESIEDSNLTCLIERLTEIEE